MPAIRKLAPDEVQALRTPTKAKGQRQQVAEEYDGYVADFAPGDYATIELGDDEHRLTVANRFKAAAQRRGIGLRFLRTTGNTMRFEVVTLGDGEAVDAPALDAEPPVGSDAPPPQGVVRSGRGRKKQGA